MGKNSFQFKQFLINQERCAMKVGTDGVLLGAWASGGNQILDIGTGTGLIALMMAQRYETATVTGIDIDADACEQAEDNVQNSPFASRMRIIYTSVQNFHGGQYDAIVSNPPYFANSLKCPSSQRNTARHTDTLSFDDLCTCTQQLLKPQGVFSIILPTQTICLFMEAAMKIGFRAKQLTHISTVEGKAPKRTLLSLTKQESDSPMLPTVKQHYLTLPNGARSPWYDKLTKDFYL